MTDWDDPADLLSITDELDFVGCNWYYDHPVFSADRQWRVPSFFENANPIADERGLDFASASLRAAADRKPLVLREWGACWPSKFRGVGLLEAAAYGRCILAARIPENMSVLCDSAVYFTVDNVDELAALICRYLDSEPQRSAFGGRARLSVIAKPSWADIAVSMERIYKLALK